MVDGNDIRVEIHGYHPHRDRNAPINELGFAPICLIPGMLVVRRVDGATIIYVSGGPDPNDTRWSRIDGGQFTVNDPYEAWERSLKNYANYDVNIVRGYVVDAYSGVHLVAGGAFKDRGTFSVAFTDNPHVIDMQMTSDKWDRFLRGHDPSSGGLTIL